MFGEHDNDQLVSDLNVGIFGLGTAIGSLVFGALNNMQPSRPKTQDEIDVDQFCEWIENRNRQRGW